PRAVHADRHPLGAVHALAEDLPLLLADDRRRERGLGREQRRRVAEGEHAPRRSGARGGGDREHARRPRSAGRYSGREVIAMPVLSSHRWISFTWPEVPPPS